MPTKPDTRYEGGIHAMRQRWYTKDRSIWVCWLSTSDCCMQQLISILDALQLDSSNCSASNAPSINCTIPTAHHVQWGWCMCSSLIPMHQCMYPVSGVHALVHVFIACTRCTCACTSPCIMHLPMHHADAHADVQCTNSSWGCIIPMHHPMHHPDVHPHVQCINPCINPCTILAGYMQCTNAVDGGSR